MAGYGAVEDAQRPGIPPVRRRGTHRGGRNDSVTRATSEWVVDLLDVQPTDHVLELGFGGGVSIERSASRVSHGFVAGIEASAVMLNRATQRVRMAINDWRVELQIGDAFDLAHEADRFDKVYAVNTVYLWERPIDVFRQMHRVLKPGGRFGVGFATLDVMRRMPFTRHGFYFHELSDLQQWVADAGMRDVQPNMVGTLNEGSHCILATK